MKIIQSTNPFQRSHRLSNWDQSGQKWESDHLNAKPVEVKAPPKAPETTPDKSADLRGKEPEAVSFKRQPQYDTFEGGATMVAKKAKPLDTAKTVVTAAFGLACLGVGVLTKNKII